MSLLKILSMTFLAGALSACLDSPVDTTCQPTEFGIASTSGDTVTTTTGLRYIDGAPGVGDAIEWCDPIRIHYTGFLLDGSQFDSSRDRDTPLTFIPGFSGVIDGVEQGVIGMRTDGTRRLIIPPELGYGSVPQRRGDGQIVIPANSTLVFDIEIVEIGG